MSSNSRSVDYRQDDGVAGGHRSEKPQYDLEERLLDYAASIIQIAEKLPRTYTGNHISGQLIRSGTSPLSNHGEAQSAESAKDFVHKMHICLKELRETQRWLRLIERIPLLKSNDAHAHALQETDQLIRIFVSSIRTAEKRTRKK